MYSDWKNLTTIGSGGQADVFKVNKDGDPQEYALKRFKNDTRAARSYSEILIMKTLWSLGMRVPQIVDDGEYKTGKPYFVTPFYKNGSLKDVLKKSPDDYRNADFCMDLCRSIREINSKGYAHRDLKPANILIDSDYRPVICDYGLGHYIEDMESLTSVGEPIGSAHYLHKDAFNIKNISRDLHTAFDGYSFGKILYEIISKKQLHGFSFAKSGDEGVRDFFKLDDYKTERFIRSVNKLLADDIHAVNAFWKSFPKELESIFQGSSIAYSLSEEMAASIRQRIASNIAGSKTTHAATNAEIEQVSDDIVSGIKRNPAIELANNLLLEQGSDKKIVINESVNLREILEGVGVKSNFGIDPIYQKGRKQSLVLKEIHIISPMHSETVGISIINANPKVIILIMEIAKSGEYIDINQSSIKRLIFRQDTDGLASLLESINSTINSFIGG